MFAACRGAVLDVEVVASDAVSLRRLRVVAGDEALDFPLDGGAPLALPQTLRLLVDARAQTVSASAVDLTGAARGDAHELTSVPAGATLRVRLDLSTAQSCPAPAAGATELALYDEVLHGAEVFGFDATRLALRDDASAACSGSRFIEYQPRGRYDGLTFATSAPRPFRRLELRLTATEVSTWRVGLDDGSTTRWLPTPEVCATDALRCGFEVGPQWRSLSLDVPDAEPASSRVVVQLDSQPLAPLTVRIDDVRAELRE